MHGGLWHAVSPTLSIIVWLQDDAGLTSVQVLLWRTWHLSVQTSVSSQAPKMNGSRNTMYQIEMSIYKLNRDQRFTCAIFVTAEHLTFIAKVSNFLWKFSFLLLQSSRLVSWIFLVAEPVAACPVGPHAHVWWVWKWGERKGVALTWLENGCKVVKASTFSVEAEKMEPEVAELCCSIEEEALEGLDVFQCDI